MASNSISDGCSKLRRCSKQIRQQRARLYIIWRCTVLLLNWQD
ncbi:small polypeptide DEVIL 14 [Apium graveolens]